MLRPSTVWTSQTAVCPGRVNACRPHGNNAVANSFLFCFFCRNTDWIWTSCWVLVRIRSSTGPVWLNGGKFVDAQTQDSSVDWQPEKHGNQSGYDVKANVDENTPLEKTCFQAITYVHGCPAPVRWWVMHGDCRTCSGSGQNFPNRHRASEFNVQTEHGSRGGGALQQVRSPFCTEIQTLGSSEK